MSRRRPGPEGLLVLTMVLWGVNFPVLKVALSALDPAVVNAVRLTLSAVVLGVLYARRQEGAFFEPIRTVPGQVVGLGLLGFFAFPVVFLLGVEATTAGTAALIMASAPLWTAVVGRLLGIEEIPGRAWAGLGLAAVGTAVVVAAGTEAVALSGATLTGNALVALAAVLWGSYTTLNRRALQETTPLALTFFGVVVALVPLWLVAAPAAGTVDWGGLSTSVWGAVAFAGVFGTGLGFVWWAAGVKAVGPSRTSVYNNGVPIVALAVGVFALSEPIGIVQLAGAALTLGGVTVVRRAIPRGQRPEAAGPPIRP